MTPDPWDSAWVDEVRADWAAARRWESPPAWALARARRLFRERNALRASRSDMMTRIRAALVFDSRGQVAAIPAGVRSGMPIGAGGTAPWQLLYRGGDIDVDLLVRPNKDGRTLHVRGQALPVSGGTVGSGVVEAIPRGLDVAEHVARTAIEPTGVFTLPGLERGQYDVLLRLEVCEIELSDLEF